MSTIESVNLEEMGSIPDNYTPKDYDLKFLLDRAYNSFGFEKERVKLERPNVERKNRKTYIHNFWRMSKCINRDVEDMRIYFQDELRMDTSLKPDKSLFIDKVVPTHGIEKIFQNYVMNHVMCPACHSIKTRVDRIDRINYLICGSCGMKKSV